MNPTVLLVFGSITAIASIFISGYMAYKLLPFRHLSTTKARLVFWLFVAIYGWGKAFAALRYGHGFLRYNLNDLGFVAVFGGLHGRGDVLFAHPLDRIRKSKGSTYALRLTLTLATLAGIAFEFLTGVYLPAHHAAKAKVYYTHFDYMDTTTYVISWAILWVVAGKMWVVERPIPVAAATRPTAIAPARPALRDLPDARSATTRQLPDGRRVAPTSRTNGPSSKRPRR